MELVAQAPPESAVDIVLAGDDGRGQAADPDGGSLLAALAVEQRAEGRGTALVGLSRHAA